MNTEEDYNQIIRSAGMYNDDVRTALAKLGPMTLYEAAYYALLSVEELQKLLKERRIQFRETTENGQKRIIIHRQAIDDYMMGQTNVTRHLTIINDTLVEKLRPLQNLNPQRHQISLNDF